VSLSPLPKLKESTLKLLPFPCCLYIYWYFNLILFSIQRDHGILELGGTLENRLVVAKGEEEGEGVGWTGSLGLIDVNYCLWDGLAMRSCCVALGTMSSDL